MASCKCQAGVCEHHAASQPCPNSPMEGISYMIDFKTSPPVSDSAHALCRECWQNQAADYYEQ
jgi:hypothetical protein